jgi:SAM-dependent methyltransferase
MTIQTIMDFTNAVRNFPIAARQSALVLARRILPSRVRDWLGTQQGLRLRTPLGGVRFGNLRRVTPVSRVFGFDRGHCIDRYYIENFLGQHAEDIHGRVLEVADNSYTKRFGGDRVTTSDVLYLREGNPKATVVGDLSGENSIPSETFNCIIFTQTLQFIYNFQAAISSLHRVLKPGGVLLATFPGISQISRYDMERWGDYWRFTTASARRLFEEAFSPANVRVASYGNVLAANAFLHGLVEEDLRRTELDVHDPDYELLITVRAVKSPL